MRGSIPTKDIVCPRPCAAEGNEWAVEEGVAREK